MSEQSDTFGRSIHALMEEKDRLNKEAKALVDEALAKQRAFLEELAVISAKQEANILKSVAADEAIRKIAGLFKETA